MSSSLGSIALSLLSKKRFGMANLAKDIALDLGVSEKAIYAGLCRLRYLHENRVLSIQPIVDISSIGLKYLAIFRRYASCYEMPLPFVHECFQIIPSGCIYILYVPIDLEIEEKAGLQITFDIELSTILIPEAIARIGSELLLEYLRRVLDTARSLKHSCRKYTYTDLVVLDYAMRNPLFRYRELASALGIALSAIRKSVSKLEDLCLGYSIATSRQRVELIVLLRFVTQRDLVAYLLDTMIRKYLVKAYISFRGYVLTMLNSLNAIHSLAEYRDNIVAYFLSTYSVNHGGIPHVKNLEYIPRDRQWNYSTLINTLIALSSDRPIARAVPCHRPSAM